MKTIRIKNLRSLEDTKEVEIKPLTVLLGANSVGKSTFLRLYPLLSQTTKARLRHPILWYSESGIDFGSFAESLNNRSNDNSGTMTFEFNFNLHSDESDGETTNVAVEIEEERVKSLSIKSGEISIELLNNEKKKGDGIYDLTYTGQNRIHQVVFRDEFQEGNLFFSSKMDITNLRNNEENMPFDTFIVEKLIKEESHLIDFYNELLERDGNNKESQNAFLSLIMVDLISSNIKRLLNVMSGDVSLLKNKKEMQKIHKNKKNEKLKNNIVGTIITDYGVSDELYRAFIGLFVSEVIKDSSRYISSYFQNTQYVAPLRAVAQRYYRKQGLSVDSIDHHGANIAIVLSQMPAEEKKEFEKWCEKKFGFLISAEQEGEHLSVFIKKSKNSTPINLADTGFGFSQITPILMILWKNRWKENYSKNRHRNKSHLNLVIEQPELHLHPSLQARTIDTIVESLRYEKSNQDLNIILETHSETIINRLGELIYGNKISKEDVKIYIFTQSREGTTQIQSVDYDDQGVLVDWPIDFFLPGDSNDF